MATNYVPSRTTLPSIPDLSSIQDVKVREALQAVKEILEIWRDGSVRGTYLDKAVTWRQLYEQKLVTLGSASSPIAYAGTSPYPVIPSPPSLPGSDEQLDFSIPPAVTGLIAAGATLNAILTWDDSSFSQVDYYEVWRASINDLSQAIRIGTTEASLFADNLGQGGFTRYYWVRVVSKAGIASPFNSSVGTAATTGQVDTGDIAPQAIDTALIADAAIVEAKIGNAAITNAKIKNADIDGTAKIRSASITSAVIAVAGIGGVNIANAAISEAKIQTAAVSTAKIQNAAITNAKIGSAAVNTLNLAGNAVTVPASTAPSDFQIHTASTWIDCATLIFNTEGQPTDVFASLTFQSGLSGISGCACDLRIAWAGIVIYTTPLIFLDNSSGPGFSQPVCVATRFHYGTISTLQLQVRCTIAQTNNFQVARSIYLGARTVKR